MKINLDHTKIIITKSRGKILKIAIKIIIAIVLIILFCSGLVLANKNKIVRGLRTANVSIGGIGADKAQIKLNQFAEDFLKKDVVLRYGNWIWTVLPEKLAIEIDIDSTLAMASKIGHQKNIFLKIGQQILGFFGYYNLPLSYSINEIQLENFIREKLNSIDNPAINAGWEYDEKTKNFAQITSSEGIIIDRKDFKLKLQNKIEKLKKDEISLILINDYPEILENETLKAYNKAQEILTQAPYKLIIKDPLKPAEIILKKEDLISMLDFRPIRDKNNPENKILGINLNQKALNDYLTALSSSINRTPIDAQLKVEGNRVTNFAISQNGLKLEIEKNVFKLQEEILNKEAKNLPAGKAGIELEVSIVPPKIATKDINNLGITTLLAKGESNFAGSPANRIHNIKVGAAKFHGVLLRPDEEFSFNTILGEVGPETGYKAELVIKQNKTVPEYGGGLCQVSTTAFRAAFNTGLPIKERQAHAFPVKYYNPQGFDATIYPPHPDLRFINDTPGYLLVQTKVKNNDLIFEFYGTSDSRRVEIEGPYQYDIKPDGSMKARLIRKIFDKDNNFIRESVFNSSYKSPALYPVERNPLE